MQDLDPSDICKKKFLNPLKRIRVIIRTPTHGRTDGRTDRQTDRQTDGRTNRVNPVYPPQLCCGGYNDKHLSFGIWCDLYERFDSRSISWMLMPWPLMSPGHQHGNDYVEWTCPCFLWRKIYIICAISESRNYRKCTHKGLTFDRSDTFPWFCYIRLTSTDLSPA